MRKILVGAAVFVVLAYVADLLSRGIIRAEVRHLAEAHPLPVGSLSGVIAAANRITREAAASTATDGRE